jgi:GT2 family glycosyltransferase
MMSSPISYSIIIPTWNNLPFLQLCIQSIEEHSSAPHEIIVHVNENKDDTIKWLESKNLPFTYTPENTGVCVGVNMAARKATRDWIVYMNDDMYVLPGWDTALNKAIQKAESNLFYLSSTMIEPVDTGNPCVVVADFGRDIESFKKEVLLRNLPALNKTDWNGASWPPSLMPIELWKAVGGLDESFSPGMYSDPDLSMKLWQMGVRHFQGVGNSLVYHFQSKSTGKVIKNDGRKQFFRKWKISASVFYKKYLKMGSGFCGPLPDKKVRPGLKDLIKRLWT